MAEHHLSILHVSDLHARSADVAGLPEGIRAKRGPQVRREAASRARVLGLEWENNLRALYSDGTRPDLVCFTGDVADWGLASEYVVAQQFIDVLGSVLGVGPERIYVVPGNHDVQRYQSKAKWKRLRELVRDNPSAVSKWLAGDAPPRAVSKDLADAVLSRTAAFWTWVEQGLGRPELLPNQHAHGRLGYRHQPSLGFPFPVHVIGFDSAWLAGDDSDKGQLWLTQHQRDMLLNDEHGKRWPGFRLALVHHPLTELADPDIGRSQRDLAESVDLLLHGHQHDPVGSCLIDLDGRKLRVLAAGCLFEGSEGREWKNGCQRIDVTLDESGRPLRAEIHFRAWSPRGHWHPDSSLYRNQTADGRMHWQAWDHDQPRSGPTGSEPQVRPLTSSFEGPGGLRAQAIRNFTGRVTELQQLERSFDGHETVCVVATGIGGIGKTTLVQQFVAVCAPQCFPDGSAWIDATRLTQDLDRVCRRFGWTDERELTPDEAIVWLARALQERRFLLVVDNVGASAIDLRHVPRPGGKCRTLVTSRDRTLHDDLDAGRLELGVWSSVESLEYLRARCERLQGLADDDVEQLAGFVGRLPLGVKLLASFLLKRATLKPSEALAILREQPVATLEKYRGQAPGLVATFQHTYENLDERGRRVLRTLSVCARQTRTHVVGEVAGVEMVEEVLDELHGHSLVEWNEGAEAPWALHDVVRMFVAAQPELEVFEAAHSDWAEAYIRVHADVLDHLAFDLGVEEALEALHRLVAGKDLERAMRIYTPLFDHLTRTGQYPLALESSQRILDAVPKDSVEASQCMNNLGVCYKTLGDIEKAIDFLQSCLAFYERLGWPEGQAAALGNLGLCSLKLDYAEKAIDFFQRSLAIDEGLGNRQGQAASLGHLGICYGMLGDIEKEVEFLECSLAIYEDLGDLEGQANQLGNLGTCYRMWGNIEKAIDLHIRSLIMNEKLGSLQGQSDRLGGLGVCYLTLGDIGKATDFYQRSLAIEEKLGRFDCQARALGELGNCRLKTGDIEKAIDFYKQSLAIEEKFGSPTGEAVAIGNLGLCYWTLDIGKSIDFHKRSLAVYEKFDHLKGQADQLGNLGSCYLILGDIKKAIDFYERGLAIANGLGDLENQAHCLGNLGLCYRRLGKIEKGIDFLQRALAISEKLGSLEGQALNLSKLARIHNERGQTKLARGMLERALTFYKQMGLPPEHGQIVSIRAELALAPNDMKRQRRRSQ